MKRFKVLFITAWYTTKEEPVKHTFIREHVKAVQLYDDVTLIHVAGQDKSLKGRWRIEQEFNESLAEGIRTFRLWYRRFPVPKISYLTDIWCVFQAFRHIVAQGFLPDIIHAHIYETAVPAVIIGRLYNIPVIVTEHYSAFPRKLLRRFDIWKAKFAFKLADIVMPVSKFLQQSIEEYGIKARFCVVPNIVDTHLFYPDSDFKSTDNLKRLLAVCLLDSSHNKGLPYLFDALSMLQMQREDWHLDIVGDGVARSEYESIVKDLGLTEKVMFHGLKTKKEVAEFMRHSDIFVLSSLFETFSVATAEALATGTPVLATRCGGPEGFINDNVGLLIPPGDAKALCNGLNYMIDNLKKFSPDYISNYAVSLFSPERVGEQLHDIYSAYIKINN